MEEQEPQTRDASHRRTRRERSEYVLQFAPLVEEATELHLEEELEKGGNEDE